MKTIYTIGFVRKTLQEFIERLREAGVREVIDVRLRNTSQLSGWSKSPDFAYLLTSGFGLGYEHHPEFAPTDELLEGYKKTGDWPAYEAGFHRLLADRRPEREAWALLEKEAICLLCSEPQADQCHRRLVAEYLKSLRPEVEIRHL
ncbi:MAG: DUF488 domain-containing protein [Candidatus Tectomicrobia bacterium]|uniref:DUF488 domain-containing protein n=1 Tax=Tectimicrobiota bacterium TaxID=2528274 RepID=A0A932CLF4_UNCTE|nr:DUF488 domain-containing protein [Candidatus Tectomicrobia bacterium]